MQHIPKFVRRTAMVLAVGSLCSLGSLAARVETDEIYTFSAADFSTGTSAELKGLCFTELPNQGILRLGSREIRPGDILTAEQAEKLKFYPQTTVPQEAHIQYLPICENRVEPEQDLTVFLQKTENQAPVAQDGNLETYKNLENSGALKATDPEAGPLQYYIVSEPKRGTVELREDGSFLYTPKENKVGKDSFTFVVTDGEGAVSNEARITVEILKPLDSTQYQDVETGQFEALWLRDSGLYSGREVAGKSYFEPEALMSRGDFLAMLMELLDIPAVETVSSGFADEAQAQAWMRPYLSAAMRLGLVSGYREAGKVYFKPNQPITGAEAVVMIQNILQLPQSTAASAAPDWAEYAVSAMEGAEIDCPELSEPLTRLQAAELLYACSQKMQNAPGLQVFGRDFF